MKVITANRLTDGRVVYFTAEKRWAENPDEAVRLSEVVAEDSLALASRDVLSVVGPYLIDVDDRAADFRPVGRKHVRETIRHAGPSAGSTRSLAEA
ncbi:unnamed protein product [Chrysoparadoxa australica]